MFCSSDSEDLLQLIFKARGAACLLQDAEHLVAAVALPLIRRQMQASVQTR
jgi:hypothetical protein